MIDIKCKKDCCGCGACVQKCPKYCISMNIDDEGFFYPLVDKDSCVECGLCEKVCPVIHQDEIQEPLKCIAAKGKRTNIVKNSSSAGIFYLLAEKTIQRNGIVFGARFNETWDVVHSWTDSLEGVYSFMTSKYVQSQIGNCYKQTEFFLKEGKEVLFTGTPCQIAGLRHFLRKDYDNLICVDVICHGTPSPGVWREYLKYEISPKGQKNSVSSPIYSSLSKRDALRIMDISFRDKEFGWKKFSFLLQSSQGLGRSEKNTVSSSYTPIVRQKHYHNLYMKTFLHNLTLRQSCFECPARKGKSGSDILLGDFWSVTRHYPDFFDKNGVSMALAYSETGVRLLDSLELDSMDIRYSDTKSNLNIELDEKKPADRMAFFEDFRRIRIKAMKYYCKKKASNLFVVYGRATLYKIKMLFK